MVDGKEHFAILKALKRLFGQFFQHSVHVAAFFIKKTKKIEKSAFHSNLKQCLMPNAAASVPLRNIFSSCEVNVAIISAFHPLHYL